MIDAVLKELRDVRGRRVFLQVPEGLKHRVPEIVEALEKNGNEVYVQIDPVYGACDVREDMARRVGADMIIHVGHAPFPLVKTEIPVKYVEIHLPVDVEAVVNALRRVPGEIALCTTVQYVHALEEIKKRLPRVVFGKGGLAAYPGQILGCDASACAVEADANVFLGDGIFHPIAMYGVRKRPTYVVSPRGELKDVTKECERFYKVRQGLMARAYEADRWGIVVTTKPGQMNAEAARQIRERARKAGKRADILVCDYFYPEYVIGMPYDVYIFTGCPRVALDDWRRYEKPVLTASEALEVLRWLEENL